MGMTGLGSADGRRWARGLLVAGATAAGIVAVHRLRRRRDESGFTRIPIEGESAAVDR
ncbi:MAG: hypothetical protein ABEJ28_09615 [Salinigranum sp.]